jgi:hypothetical protein
MSPELESFITKLELPTVCIMVQGTGDFNDKEEEEAVCLL